MAERSRLGTLALATQVALGINALGHVVGTATNHGLGRVLDSHELTSVGTAFTVPAAVLFIAWLLSAQSVLRARGIKQSGSAAVIGWFLCGLNLVMPYVVLRELESRARAPEEPLRGSPQLRAWGVAWVLFLLASVVRSFLGPILGDLVNVIVAVAGAALAGRVAGSITRLLESDEEEAPLSF